MSTVSLALLTWNRASVFTKTMDVTLRNGGRQFDSIIWTDNGSHPDQYAEMSEFMNQFPNVTKIRYPQNTGMPCGFNTSMALSRCDYVILMGPDVFMPENWVKIFCLYMDTIPDAGVVAMWNVPPDKVPERLRASGTRVDLINGLPVLRAMPMDHYIIRRSTFQQTGYWREDFGLYGWSDVEYLERCEKILPRVGFQCYVIPEWHGNHLASDGAEEFRKGVSTDTPEYHDWKQAEAKLAHNHSIMHKCRTEGNPYYSPF